MSKLLTSEEMMLVGGGCSRALSNAIKRYNESRGKNQGHRERRCSER